MVDLFSLTGKTVVVTGGFGLIGRSFTTALMEAGAQVAVLEMAPTPERTAAAFGPHSSDPRLKVLAADVTDKASLERALQQTEAAWGAPFGLINNAALDSPPDAPPEENGPFETYPEASFDKVMSVNVKGVFLTSQVFGAAMARAGRGSIVNVASIYGAVSPDQSLYEYRRQEGEAFYKPVAYAASKSALYNLTRYLAVYWGGQNVRANTVTFAGVFNNQDPRFLEAYARKIPLRRGPAHAGLANMASAQDYVGAAIFLMSDASSYMTGADLRIDGGFLSI